ncbi:hypothetical protein REJ26_000783 [Providencia stuartii]|uniref:hypothetical protein n=1 Tax=Providencia TaxID=586 RepID=UPI0029412B26|nr:hypothetical protein [Providencia sp. 2023EL-00965]ELR5299052.1 hypothetical protein [Providencia stuartii]MDW7587492.1 hypothetical protein [Providencia sp. 2023EL-00965]
MDKSRQQFEYWYFNNHSHEQKYPLHKDESGEYFYDGTRKAWIAWKASRESLEIELPNKYNLELAGNVKTKNFFYGINQGIDKCRDILISNGVKIKNE